MTQETPKQDLNTQSGTNLDNNEFFPLPKEHWLPNYNVNNCMICQNKFLGTLFRSGRHHCRSCGRVTCDTCSQYFIGGNRVCVDCVKTNISNRSSESKLESPIPYSIPELQTSTTTQRSELEPKEDKQQETLSLTRISSNTVLPPTPQHELEPFPYTKPPSASPEVLQKILGRYSAKTDNKKNIRYNEKETKLKKEGEQQGNDEVNEEQDKQQQQQQPQNQNKELGGEENLNNKFSPNNEISHNSSLSLFNSNSNKLQNNNRLLLDELNNLIDFIEAKTNNKKSSIMHTTPSPPMSPLKNLDNKLNRKRSHSTDSKEELLEYLSNEKQDRQQRAIDQLGSRMKLYEKECYNDKILDKNLPYIVRLDGHNFHTFTKGFKRPFDERLHSAMVNTTKDLVEKFHALTGYTQSDEISLLFPAIDSENTESMPLFGGRIVKISSVLAGFTSVRFSHYIKKGNFKTEPILFQEKIYNCYAHFDGRVFNLPSKTEVLNNFLWRCHFDATRNSISSLARKYFTPKQLHKKSTKELLLMLKNEKNVDWYTYPLETRYGTFVKKNLYEKECINPITKESIKAIRTEIVSKAIELNGYHEKYINLLFSKYWLNDFDYGCQQLQQQQQQQQE